MKKGLIIIMFLILALPLGIKAQDDSKKKALYFYSENCSLCQEVDVFFSDQGMYDKYDIKKIEVSGPYNLNYLNEFFDVFGVNEEKRGWPAIVLGDEMIIGSQSIIEKFENRMESGGNEDYPVPLEIKKRIHSDLSAEVPSPGISSLVSFSMLFSAALIDSVSPCSFAVIVILLNLIFFINDKRRSFFLGISFMAGGFLAYLLIGLGFMTGYLDILPISKFVSITMGIVSIIAGIIISSEAFRLERTFLRRAMHQTRNYISRAVRPLLTPVGSLVMGLISVLFLIPCASRPYLVTARIFSKDAEIIQSFISLLLYNLIFLLPIFIMFIAIFGIRNRKFKMINNPRVVVTNGRLIDIIMGAIMVFSGIYLIQNWI